MIGQTTVKTQTNGVQVKPKVINEPQVQTKVKEISWGMIDRTVEGAGCSWTVLNKIKQRARHPIYYL